MITFENGIDARSREPQQACVARFHKGNGVYVFVVIGTAYGHYRTAGGDVRTWLSYSGARRAALAYRAL